MVACSVLNLCAILELLLLLEVTIVFGEIPTGSKPQSFDPSAYEGNKGLCCYPLSNKCQNDEPLDERLWLCASILVGFITGLGGVCGALLLSRSYRHALCQYVDKLGHKIYVLVSIK